MIKPSLVAVLAAGLAAAIPGASASPGPQPAPPVFSVPAPRDVAYPGVLDLHVDATDLAHRIFDVHERVPVQAGPLTLLYPQWIPGHHSPTGPIDKLAGLVIRAGGKRLAWQRDPGNVYAFHVDVPQGVGTLDLHFQYLSPQKRSQGRVVMTPEMLNLQWNTVALYPAGYFARDIRVRPSVTLPQGWTVGTALGIVRRTGSHIDFKPIDFENLVDSPIFAGQYARRIDLAPGAKTPVFLDVFADAPADLKITPAQIRVHRQLVQQMYRLYGAHHYNHYDFLLALSDKLSGIGLEHHRSSEDGASPGYFTHWGDNWIGRDLLAHEFNHSWDGKYRRPAGLWTPNYNVVKRDHGLWVYEGQTQFWGYVIAARAGLWNHDQAMQQLALLAATYDRGRPGLAWRTIWDTTNDPTIAERAPLPYRNYQMSEDYYSGGQLIWFAVDAKLRALTHDRRSLDDFARAFFGMHNGAWDISTYTFGDVVATLDKLAPYDWKTFLMSRLRGHVDLADGLRDEGWKVVYDAHPSDAVTAREARYHFVDLSYSLGLTTRPDGALVDVLWNGPAFRAGLAPGMHIVAVDGHAFKPALLRQAVTDAVHGKAPIDLTVKNFDEYSHVRIDYHGGLKYPHLVRLKGRPDYLRQVLAPRR